MRLTTCAVEDTQVKILNALLLKLVELTCASFSNFTCATSARLPYEEALAPFGLALIREQARQPFNAGITVDWRNKESLTIGSVRNNSPAEDAGLEEGDEIISLGKKKIDRENFLVSLARFKQGDRVPITVKRNRRTIQASLVLGPPERFEYRIEERKDATPQQKALREAWLNGS